MTNPITPKVAYIPLECTLSVDQFLKMWEEETSGQEGEPTQKDYDTFLRSFAEDYFYDMRGEIVLKVLKEIETPDILKLSYDEKTKLADHPNTSPESLAVLSTDKDWWVRWLVAKHPNTSQETLAIFATDEDCGVRWEVAKHPNTSQETLAILETDKDFYVRSLVARNPNYKKETLELITELGDTAGEVAPIRMEIL